jgi:hypothetical protein
VQSRSGRLPAFGELMAESGWMAVRVRGLTRDGYLEQVRGYSRDTRGSQPICHS